MPEVNGTSPSALNGPCNCSFPAVSERILNSVGVQIGLVASFLLASGVFPDVRAQIPQQVITTNAESAVSVHAADLNGDGAVDVLSASLADDKIAWYESQIGDAGADGDGFGVQKVITTDLELVEDVHAADLDGDGDADILSASSFDDKLAWYENRIGEARADSDGFGPQKTITTSADGAQSVFAADLDGDGDRDVLTPASNGDKIAWYENQVGEGGDGNGFGPEQVITTSAETAYSVFATDLDGDGDADVLSASSFDDKVAWYENKIDEERADRDGFASQQVITSHADGAVAVYATDLDGDGDADVLLASSYDDRVAWSENQIGEGETDGNGFGDLRTITTEASYAASIFAADLDGDGDADVLSASRFDDRVAWYENQVGERGSDGDGFGSQETITTDADEAQSVHAADLNGSGRVDVLSASTNDDKVAWYANTDGALPIELVAFEGRWTDHETVALTWHTASETQNARFEVQRKNADKTSAAGAWSTIGRVHGSGTTGERRTYRYLDADLPVAADSLSYRLRQVDVDGSVHLTRSITIGRAVQRMQLRTVYPNPARNRVTVRFAVPEGREVLLRLHDVLGRKVRTLVDQRSDGRHTLHVDVSGLPSGTYFLRLRTGSETQTERLTVTR